MTPQEAVQRARSVVGKGGMYILGTGDYRPRTEGGKDVDLPWTRFWKKDSEFNGRWGSDCAGFAICWAWKLRRSRPGFNVGPWATVSSDINSDSTLEDGLHKQELFTVVPEEACVQPGDLIIFPSIRREGKRFKIGHVGIIEDVPAKFRGRNWKDLVVIQAHGPTGRAPGVVRTDGSTWVRHDTLWGKPEHRTKIVRVKY